MTPKLTRACQEGGWCKVPMFQSFKVAKFQRFKFSKFQSRHVSKIQKINFMFFNRYCSYIQGFHELSRSSGFFGPRLFQQFQNVRIPKLCDFPRYYFQKGLRFFLGLLEVIWCFQIKIPGFGSGGHVSKSENHANDAFGVFRK